MVGYAICGSFCTHKRTLEALERVARRFDVTPILSPAALKTDTRFGTARELTEKVTALSGRNIVSDIVSAEPLGPAEPLDLLIIAPCTGNTLSKIAHGISDTAVTMAAKAHARGNGAVLIALASNDAMSANLANIATLLNRKGFYFVPMVQDDPVMKPHSLVADFDMIDEAIDAALEDRQLRPLFK